MGRPLLMAHSLEQAWQLYAEYPGAYFIAGGTDVIPRLNQKIEQTPALIGLQSIPGLCGVTTSAAGLTIGALTKLTELTEEPLLAGHAALIQAAGRVASPQIRNQATIGGNLLQENRCVYFNQSVSWRRADSCFKLGGNRCYQYKGSTECVALLQSDLAPVLIAQQARLIFNGPQGRRELPLAELYLPAGAKAKQPQEILTEILLPQPQGELRSAYVRETIRGSFDFPLISCAALVEQQDGLISRAALVLGSAGVMPQAVAEMSQLAGAPLTELAARRDELIAAGRKKIAPFRDSRVDASARRAMGEAVMAQALQELLK